MNLGSIGLVIAMLAVAYIYVGFINNSYLALVGLLIPTKDYRQVYTKHTRYLYRVVLEEDWAVNINLSIFRNLEDPAVNLLRVATTKNKRIQSTYLDIKRMRKSVTKLKFHF